MSVTTVVVAIVALAFLIVVHEGGHFIVARLCGMRVERFSIGFGNPLVSFKRGDTIYQIAPIPLGGFVQITGLNPHEEFDRNDPYVYPNRPRWMRLAVLVAGPAANYISAVVLAFALLMGYGRALPVNSNIVDVVMQDTPAEKAGLRAGDVLKQANDVVLTPEVGVSKVVQGSQGAPVVIKLERDGKPMTITVTPQQQKQVNDYRIGVGLVTVFGPVSFPVAVKESVILPFTSSAMMLRGMWDMITRKVEPELSGPVGIVKHLSNSAKRGGHAFLDLVIMLSIYLGLFNLLPLPALDGGRVLFLGINSLRRTDVNAKTEATVHMVGLLLLLGVFVVVTFTDIKSLFQ